MNIKVIYSTMIIKNLKQSEDFYENVLGFSKGYHVDLPFGGITIMQSKDGACVELIEAPQFPLGLYSVGTDVEDLDEAIKTIKDKGGNIIGEIIPTSVGRQIFLLDPDGNRLCLIEHNKDYKEKYM